MSQWTEFVLQQEQECLENGVFVPVVEDVIVEIKGADAAKLLQGQITADVDGLDSGQFALSALCTNKGRVISYFHVLRTEQGFLCRLPEDNAEQFANTLKKYGIFYKVEISIRQDIGIFVAFEANTSEPLSEVQVLEHGPQLTEYWVEKGQWQQIWRDLGTTGAPAPTSVWEQSKISHGWPNMHLNTSEQFLPHALSLDLAEAISFTKGCYTGQEIVARTHYRGKSKKRLARLQMDMSALSSGTEISSLEGRNLGTVVNSVDLRSGVSEMLVSIVDISDAGEFSIEDNKVSYKKLVLPWLNE